MVAMKDDVDGLPPSPVRTLSAQRVAITMNPDGSITKHKPAPSSTLARQAELDIDEELELEHPTVAAPVRGPDLDADEPVAPAALQGLPIDTGAVTESTVMKDAVDDERTHDVSELDGKHLNETKHVMNGVPKEDLWMLMRRFDKNVQHVRAIDPNKKLHGGKLDLRIADKDEDPFSPDKLRAALERLYLTIGLSMLAFSKHMARLSNWTDQNRTAVFASVYFVAWVFNLLLPAIGIFLATLIAVPASRSICFPPESLVVIDHATSGNAPAAASKGEKHSTTSATGAPEAQKGEAAEQEATSFIAGIGSLAIGIGTGTEGPSEKDGEDDSILPDPVTVAGRATDAMDTAAQGRKHHTKDNKAKVPVQNAMWETAKPVMHGLAAACDTWEKLGNALSPTPPFHKNGARFRLAALLVPVILGAPFINYAAVFKGVGFAVGAGFFGQIWIIKYSQQGLEWLNTNYPNWMETLDLGRTLLRGVPSDAQLTLTLLRIAEAQNEPLPPPPSTTPAGGAPPSTRQDGPQFDKEDSSDDEDDSDLEHPYEVGQANAEDAGAGADGKPPRKGARSRLAGLLRGTAKVGAGAIELVHEAEAATIGAARDKVGVLPPRMARTLPEEGPDVFNARHRGKRGFILLDRGATGPAHADVRFVRGRRSTEAARVNIADVVEIRKIGGLGWKGRLLAGWALGVDIPDGVELTTRAGEKVLFTAMPRRDELFNRLVAMGAQRWEVC